MAQVGFPDWQASVLQWAEAGKDTFYYRSDNSSTLAWGETYNLQTYNIMYQVDGDTLWLHKLAKHGYGIMASAKDVPDDTLDYNPLYQDNHLGWGTLTYTDEYDEYLVHEGHFCTELAKFIRYVYQDENLYSSFGTRADSLLRFIEKNVVNKWYSIWYEPRVAYPGELGTNDVYHKWIGGQHLDQIPVNRYAAFGNFLLELSQITQSDHYTPVNTDFADWYVTVIEEMIQAFRSILRYDASIDAYQWGYSTHGHDNDLSHSAIEVAFAYDCYQYDMDFDHTDMKRFAHTLTRHLWKNPSDIWNAELWDSFDQSEWSSTSLDTYSRKWALYGVFDPLVCAIESGVMRELAQSGAYSSGVFATGISALALVNKLSFPIITATDVYLSEISGDGDNFPDPGDELELIIGLVNWGNEKVDSLDVSLFCQDNRIEITKEEAQYTNIFSMDTLDNNQDPFILKINPAVTAGSRILIFLAMQSGEYIRNDSVEIIIGPVPILLVDDDGGADYESFYRLGVLDSLDLYPYWDVEKMGSPKDYLLDYEKIVWFTGDQLDNTLIDDDKEGIRNYLDGGGKMLLFGIGIEYDIINNSPVDTLFFRDYLHASPSDDSMASSALTVKTVYPDLYPTQYFVVYANDYDVFRAIEPGSDAIALVEYFHGTAMIASLNQHRIAYTTFGLENLMQGTTETEKKQRRRYLLNRLLTLLDLPSSNNRAGSMLPSTFQLRTYPNPFNEGIIIEFDLNRPTELELQIYDVRGCLVKNLFTGKKEIGKHRIFWDSRNQSGDITGSGIYFVQVKYGQKVKTIKICHMQ
jgi:hypothetical protein